MLGIYFNDARTEPEENFLKFKKLSLLAETIKFYYTPSEGKYKKFLQLCKEMINHKQQFQTNLVFFQPDHKRCYFQAPSLSVEELNGFLHMISKPALRYYDEFTLRQSILYEKSIVVWFVEDEEKDEFYQIFEDFAEQKHDHYMFSIVNGDTYRGKQRSLKIFKKQGSRKIMETDFLATHHLMIDLGIEKSDFPCLFIVTYHSEHTFDSWKYKGSNSREEFESFF